MNARRLLAPVLVASAAIPSSCGPDTLNDPIVIVGTNSVLSAWEVEDHDSEPSGTDEELVYEYDDSGISCNWDLSQCKWDSDTDYIVRVRQDVPVAEKHGAVVINAASGNYEKLFPPQIKDIPPDVVEHYRDEEHMVTVDYRVENYYTVTVFGTDEDGESVQENCSLPYNRSSRALIELAGDATSVEYKSYFREMHFKDADEEITVLSCV